MFLSNPAKIFHIAYIFPFVFAGCSLWQGNENSTVTFASQTKIELPFSTREPDVFQAEIVIRAGETERRIYIARDGAKRRIDYDIGTDNHREVLLTDREYTLSHKRKSYSERPFIAGSGPQYEPLTSHLLNERDYVDFEAVGRDGPIIQFRARIRDSETTEVVITFDEKIGMPVMQEFYTIVGDQRKLQYSAELRGFRTDVEATTFQIPPGFKKVTRAEN